MSVVLFSSLYNTLLLSLLALSFWVIYRQYPSIKSAQLWFYAYIFLSLSMIMMFYRGLGNENLLLVTCLNIFFYLTLLLDFLAITIWVKKPVNLPASIGITALIIIIHMYFLFVDDRIEIRVLIIRSFIMVVSFACCYQIFSSQVHRNIGHKLAALFLLVLGLFNAAAFFDFIDGDLQTKNMEVKQFYQLTSTLIATSAAPLLFCSSGIFYLLGLLLERLKDEHDNATIDPLTKVYNRRGFEQSFNEELKRSRRLGNPLTMAIVDLDHFKSINDDYGHSIGDEVLAKLCEHFKRHLREVDSICRLGGEEFLLLLINCDLESGYNTVERIRLDLEQRPLLKRQPKLKVTASFGICQTHKEADSFDSLYKRCDTLLYEAKEAGRNRCIKDHQVINFE